MMIVKTTRSHKASPSHRVSPTVLRVSSAAVRRPVFALALMALMWTATPATVMAQASEGDQNAQAPTRTELLESLRRATADTVETPTRSSVERGLRRFRDATNFVGNLRGGWKGFHFATGDFPAGAGFAYGLGFTELAMGSPYAEPDLPNRVEVRAIAASSNAGYRQVGGKLVFHRLGGGPFSAAVRGQYYEFPQEDFFGLGPQSVEQNRTSFLVESTEVGADVWWTPVERLRVGGSLSYLDPSIGSGTDNRYPSTEELFDRTTLSGFRVQPNFRRIDGWIDFDGRDNPSDPRAGGFYRVRISDFQDRDLDTFAFRRVEVDVQQYLSLSQKHQVIALRASAVVTHADAGNEVPFYYQPTLGGKQTLRGFREFRFRDRNSLLFTAEYRWAAWWALDPALFVDAGKVASRRNDLDLSNLEVSYGIGFRFHSTNSFMMRLDLAKSREGFIPFLRFDHAF